MIRPLARLVSTLVLVAMGIGCASPALGADDGYTTVRLRPGVRVEPGHPITLADVATVEGPQAALLSPIRLAGPLGVGDEPVAVRVDAVLEAIDAVDGIHRGRLAVTGTSCTVIARRPHAAPPTAARTYEPPEGAAHATLRVRILEHLRALFDVDASAVRAAFDERDDELLDTDVSRYTVELRTLGGSDRIPLAISLYEGDRLARSASIRADVQLWRDVAVVNQPVARNERIEPDQVTTETRWVPASVTPAAPADVVGRVARSNLEPGGVVGADDVARPIQVKRGDITSIRSVVGTAVVRTKARARADGCEGDVIEFEALDRSVRFLARVVGDGRAVVAPQTGADGPFAAPGAPARISIQELEP